MAYRVLTFLFSPARTLMKNPLAKKYYETTKGGKLTNDYYTPVTQTHPIFDTPLSKDDQ